MATDGNSVDQASESLQKLAIDTQVSSGESQRLNEDAGRNERDAQTSNNAQVPPVLQPLQHPTVQLPSESAVDAGLYYAPGNFASPTYYYPGYEMPPPEWEEYPRYINADGTEGSSPGFFAENGSVLYHPGYAYAPQVAYAPYSPAASPLNPVRPDAHLYAPQHFQYPSHFYQQPLSPGVQFLPSHNPPQGEISNVGGEHSIFAGDIANMNYANMNNMSGPGRPGYPMSPVSFGSFCQGGMAVTIPSPMYDGMRIGNSFPDSPNIVDVQQRPYNTSNSTIITQTPGIQQQRQLAVIGPASVTSYNRGFSSNRTYPQTNSSGRLSPGIQSNGRASWVAVDKSKSKGRPASASCNCVGAIDGFDEQNKGPRVKSKSQVLSLAVGESKEHGLTTDAMSEGPVVNREQYNRPDFLTEYNDARFFIIKSYSEDNIHKSIKYGVWASTPNGNKRLDAAFKEVKEKADGSPIFLFFSVNASGQFCGVAEMLGPVDFERSVDYWQQDKWSGQFPVRWHIVKDVPNNLFRHITLENNENKPVTNSRDTQDVPLEKGLQMLDIFKNHVSKTSILDDFDFYESRQKLMQDKKAKQQEFNESRSYDQTTSVTLKDYPNDGVISTKIKQAIPEQAFSDERQPNLESDCKRSEHVGAGVIAAIEPKSAVDSKEVPPM